MIKKEIKIQKHGKLKKCYGLFSAIVGINKVWFICSVLIPIFWVLVFSFFYLDNSGDFWNLLTFKIQPGEYQDNLYQTFNSIFPPFCVFFLFFYFFVSITTFLFAYFIFFSQLKNKKIRFAFYSGLSRTDVFWVLIFTLFLYVLLNTVIAISTTEIVGIPFYKTKGDACWEIFNIYLNILLMVFIFILGGYLLWYKSHVLYIVFFTIFSLSMLMFACLVRMDFLSLYLGNVARRDGANKFLVTTDTLLPERIINILRYLPFIFSSMTSTNLHPIDKYVNLIWVISIGGLILKYLSILNKKVSL